MKSEEYFKEGQYTGNHFHEECWESVKECYVEAIVEERIDGSWDVFFDEFLEENEYELLFGGKEYKDTPTGIFLFTAKDNADVTKKFTNWVANVLSSHRREKNRR